MMDGMGQAVTTPAGHQRRWPVWLLLGFLCSQLMLYTPRMAFFHEEPRRAVIAQEMLLTGDLVVPTVCQEPYLKKPPLQNWLIALTGWLAGGIEEWSARLVSVLSFAGLGALLFFFLRRHEPELAWPALLVVTTNFLMLCEFANKAEPDMLLTACTLGAYVLYMHRPDSWLYVVLSGLCLGAGILTKFLSPLFFYPGIFLIHLLPFGNFRRHAVRLLVHGLVALIPVAIWLALYHRQMDAGTLLAGYVHEFAGRAPGTLLDGLRHLIGYPLKIAAVLLPWTMALVFAYRPVQHPSAIYRSSRVIFFLALLLFMLTPEGRDRYLMPAFPFFAIWCVAHLDGRRVMSRRGQRVGLLLLAGPVLAAAGYWFWTMDLLPALALAVLAGALLLAARSLPPLKLVHFTAVVGLVLFMVYEHGPYYFRAKTMFPFRETAAEISRVVTEEHPLVVDEYFSPLRLVFELERTLQRPCRRWSPAMTAPYYYLTIPERTRPSGQVLRQVPYEGNYFDTVVLQLVEPAGTENVTVPPAFTSGPDGGASGGQAD